MVGMDNHDPCMELALEGERLCKVGDYRAGVQFFEEAIQVGTSDFKTLSAIYSQVGNAYFYLQDYVKALEYHKHDMILTRTIGDKLGEAKASGNFGNTLKVLGKFDEAITCYMRHLDISRELTDKNGEAKALYNLGNAYHEKGKNCVTPGQQQEPGDYPPKVSDRLNKAVQYYEQNLDLVRELGDRASEGRTCGNLGNTYYLLGDFTKAISLHEIRLSIAKEFGDKNAERRAYSNLGNAHIFLGEFETAAEYLQMTLQISKWLGDPALEAQACYSLGNTYTLLRDYEKAIEYHMKHLSLARQLNDRVGEGRACWSLGNAHTALGNSSDALLYAEKHFHISREVGDEAGMLTAQMNLNDMKNVLGNADDSNFFNVSTLSTDSTEQGTDQPDVGISRAERSRRLSMENMELVKMTPDKAKETGQLKPIIKMKEKPQKSINNLAMSSTETFNSEPVTNGNQSNEDTSLSDESFFELLSRTQNRRIDDQRCSFEKDASKNSSGSPSREALLDMVAGVQESRMDDQRARPQFPGLNSTSLVREYINERGNVAMPDDDFFENLMKCQATRIEEQRSHPPTLPSSLTVPDDDFFSLVLRVQSNRLDKQRTKLPKLFSSKKKK